MRRKALWFLQLIFFLISNPAFTQPHSYCNLQISIFTCSPGDELYSLFGHTALRIRDSTNRTDIIYNWGTFDFNEPNFYVKFMRGKLLYFVSTDNVPDFLYTYQYEGRGVIEQVLNISCDEKMQIWQAVDSTMTGDNRFYQYDFLIDNCTTRVRDIIYNNLNNTKISGSIVAPGTTFRNMIHGYLDKGGQPWSKLGIDILLGEKVDKAVTSFEAMFLPEYLMKAFDSSHVAGKPLVGKKKLLLSATGTEDPAKVFIPLIVVSIVSILIFFISLLKSAWAISATRIADSFLLYITGIIGLLIVFMWFFTDHVACSNNYNLLWAVPSNVVVGFLVWKRPEWTKKYFLVLAAITALTLLGWIWLPQQFNSALVPFILLLLYRYLRLGLMSSATISEIRG